MIQSRCGGVPFFQIGSATAADEGSLPLGVVSGCLIMDSGEAERTFIFRCQDRYLIYNSLCGIRSVLFVANEQHVRSYERLIGVLSARLELIRDFTGLSLSGIPLPFYVPCDIERLIIEDAPWFIDELTKSDISASLTAGSLLLNQISPSYATLLRRLDCILRAHNIDLKIDAGALESLGELALRFHNKAHYVELVKANRKSLPVHVTTVVLQPEEFLLIGTWDDLLRIYVSQTGDEPPRSVYVKSSQDSGGNVARRLSARTFSAVIQGFKDEVERFILGRGNDNLDDLPGLRKEIDLAPSLESSAFSDAQLSKFRRLERDCRKGISILVQREVEPPGNFRNQLESVGITYEIRSLENAELVTAAAQLYGDSDRRHFIGSYLSDALTDTILTDDFRRRMERMCRLFAVEGYRGPINFDARLGSDGNYVLIFDCNPRLSAVYPPMALQSHLRKHGLKAETIASLGYRGEFVYADPRRPLARLHGMDLLYTKSRQKGVILLPNLARENGYDALLVNMKRSEIDAIVASGALRDSSALEGPGPFVLF